MSEHLRVVAPVLPPLEAAHSPAAPHPPGVDFRALLRETVHTLATEEATLGAVLRAPRAATATPAELLALQATVYQHARDVELASRLVDKATSALRTVLTSQS